jgi:hypothetical protein
MANHTIIPTFDNIKKSKEIQNNFLPRNKKEILDIFGKICKDIKINNIKIINNDIFYKELKKS